MKYKFKTLRNIIKSVIEHDYFGMASEMGFMLCIGICPFILFLTALFGYIGKQYFMQPIFIFMQSIMPNDVLNVVNTVLNEVFFFKKGGLVAVLGFCITLFLSTNTVAIVAKGLNRAYKVKETRNFFYSRLLALIMVFVNTCVLFLSITLIVFGKVIMKFLVSYIGMTQHFANIMLFVRWPIAFLTLFIMGLFSVYINNLHTYNFVYGTIAGFAVMMMWLYYTSILILIGGEINSQLYNKLERKKDITIRRSRMKQNDNQV